jgi:GT2 family glycosyltransferase
VVILSFNCAHLLPRAVASVQEQTYAPIELIIVDNASTDGTAELLDQYRSIATIVRHKQNLGFALGMNAGYDKSHGDFFIPLNTDAVLHPQFVQSAVELFEQQPQLGVIAPEVYKITAEGDWRFWKDPHDLQSEGGVVALTPMLRVQVLLDHQDSWRTSFKANGACPVIRRSLLTAMQQTFGVAPFDPVFDTYGEDVDFAFKAWALRWRTMFARHIVAGHVRSYASALELPDKRGRLRINLVAERYINAVRHLPLPRMIVVVALALVALPRTTPHLADN